MNIAERAVRRVDAFQQHNRVLSFLYAVIKKNGDDNGGALAATITYNAFLATISLTLLIAKFDESVLAVALGLLGFVWGSRGFTNAVQFAMAEIWDVPLARRPGFFPRLGRGVGFIGALAVGMGITTSVVSIASLAPGDVSTRLLIPIGTVLINTGLFLAAFRVVTPSIGTRQLMPGALVGGIGWSVLQVVGALIVGHQIADAAAANKAYGAVLGVLSWIYLATQLSIYASEINAVLANKLWPRAIVDPPLRLERATPLLAHRLAGGGNTVDSLGLTESDYYSSAS